MWRLMFIPSWLLSPFTACTRLLSQGCHIRAFGWAHRRIAVRITDFVCTRQAWSFDVRAKKNIRNEHGSWFFRIFQIVSDFAILRSHMDQLHSTSGICYHLAQAWSNFRFRWWLNPPPARPAEAERSSKTMRSSGRWVRESMDRLENPWDDVGVLMLNDVEWCWCHPYPFLSM